MFAIEVGRIVVAEIFDGDVKEALRKGPKARGLQALADRPDPPISAKQLSVAVGVYELLDRMAPLGEVTTWELLGCSHVRALLPAPPREQGRLLEVARERQWTVAQLSAEVGKVVRQPKGGRRRSSSVATAVRALGADVDRLTTAMEKGGGDGARGGVDQARAGAGPRGDREGGPAAAEVSDGMRRSSSPRSRRARGVSSPRTPRRRRWRW